MWSAAEAHPDDIDPDEYVDWIVVGDVLKHAHACVKARLSAEVVWEWHFVHAEWPLGKQEGCQDKMAWKETGPGGWFSLKQSIYNSIYIIKNRQFAVYITRFLGLKCNIWA